MNVGIDLAAGAWLANCDDDDEWLPSHVEVLLGDAKRRRARPAPPAAAESPYAVASWGLPLIQATGCPGRTLHSKARHRLG
jgi:hypothetical protein